MTGMLACVPHEHRCRCGRSFHCTAPSCVQRRDYPCACCRLAAIEDRVRAGKVLRGLRLPIEPEMWVTARKWVVPIKDRGHAFVQPGTNEMSRVIGFVAELAFVAHLVRTGIRHVYHPPRGWKESDRGDVEVWWKGEQTIIDVKARDHEDRPKNMLVACVQVERHPFPFYVGIEVYRRAASLHGWATLDEVQAAPKTKAGKINVYELPYNHESLHTWYELALDLERVP